MKSSFKTIAAAVFMAVAASGANAALDNGETGNGELFFNIWDANGSYTRDLNISLDAFQSALSSPGSFNQVFAADNTLSSFLSTRTTAAAVGALKFNVLANDGTGDSRILATYIKPFTKSMDGGEAASATSKLLTFGNAFNSVAAGSDSISVGNTSPAYVNKSGVTLGNLGGLSSNNYGTFAANSSYLTGLNFLRIDGTGADPVTYTQYTDGGAFKVWFDANNALIRFGYVPNYPEPETYAMLLAGLGLVGLASRRRKLAA